MGFPVSISKWNLLQNFNRTGDSASEAGMRPVLTTEENHWPVNLLGTIARNLLSSGSKGQK